jgi:hypothetical protein
MTKAADSEESSNLAVIKGFDPLAVHEGCHVQAPPYCYISSQNVRRQVLSCVGDISPSSRIAWSVQRSRQLDRDGRGKGLLTRTEAHRLGIYNVNDTVSRKAFYG